MDFIALITSSAENSTPSSLFISMGTLFLITSKTSETLIGLEVEKNIREMIYKSIMNVNIIIRSDTEVILYRMNSVFLLPLIGLKVEEFCIAISMLKPLHFGSLSPPNFFLHQNIREVFFNNLNLRDNIFRWNLVFKQTKMSLYEIYFVR